MKIGKFKITINGDLKENLESIWIFIKAMVGLAIFIIISFFTSFLIDYIVSETTMNFFDFYNTLSYEEIANYIAYGMIGIAILILVMVKLFKFFFYLKKNIKIEMEGKTR